MEEIAFKRCRGVAYRATTYDTPLWVSPNSRPGRWNHPEDETIAQYCALDVASAIAEMVRHEDVSEIDEAREMRIDVWELRIDEGAVADYSTPERAADQGLAWDRLLSDSWGACRAEGLRLMEAGGRGVIAPSAALPQGVALTLFGPRTEIGWHAEPRLSIQVPSRHIVHGAPGDGLVRDARFFGDPYPPIEQTPADRLFTLELAPEPWGGGEERQGRATQ